MGTPLLFPKLQIDSPYHLSSCLGFKIKLDLFSARALPVTSCVTLGKSHHLYASLFSPVEL